MDAPTKRCTKCDRDLPYTLEYFGKNGKGLRPDCKECVSRQKRAHYLNHQAEKIAASREYYAAHREQQIESAKRYHMQRAEWYAEYKHQYYLDHIDQATEYNRQYYIEHHEEVLLYSRQYRLENPEKAKNAKRQAYLKNRASYRRNHRDYYKTHKDQIKRKVRQYVKNNPLVKRASEHRRRARKLAAGGTHTAAEIRALCLYQQGRCWWCSEELIGEWHADHIIPLSRGGSDSINNLGCSCVSCNCSKSAQLPYTEWIPPKPLFPRISANNPE